MTLNTGAGLGADNCRSNGGGDLFSCIRKNILRLCSTTVLTVVVVNTVVVASLSVDAGTIVVNSLVE